MRAIYGVINCFQCWLNLCEKLHYWGVDDFTLSTLCWIFSLTQYSSEDFYIKFLKQKNSHNALMRSPTNHRQTTWTDTSSKKIGRWPINTLKGVQHSSIVIKEVQIKTTIDTTTHPLNWLKLKRLSMPNDSKDTKQLKLSLRHF